MNILIVSGFLGAGKTTFIKELSKKTKKEFAIFENEYASSNVDTDILKSELSKEEQRIKIWELTEGCICCSSKGDFAQSILTIANTIDPDYLVIEPTGVAKLSNVINNIKKIEYDRIKVLSPICIVDAISISRYKSEFPDIYQDQIRSASQVILSKIENFSEDEINKVVAYIKEINDKCNVTLEHYSKLPLEWWNSLLLDYQDKTVVKTDENEYGSNIETFSLTNVSPNSIEEFIIFLEDIIRNKYGNIIRAKGSLLVNNIKLHFDLADGRYSILFTDEEVESKDVFIGNNIKKQKIREILFKRSNYIKILKK